MPERKRIEVSTEVEQFDDTHELVAVRTHKKGKVWFPYPFNRSHSNTVVTFNEIRSQQVKTAEGESTQVTSVPIKLILAHAKALTLAGALYDARKKIDAIGIENIWKIDTTPSNQVSTQKNKTTHKS